LILVSAGFRITTPLLVEKPIRPSRELAGGGLEAAGTFERRKAVALAVSEAGDGRGLPSAHRRVIFWRRRKFRCAN